MKDSGNGSFVCPNDRQLQLRAKLNAGWSFHTSRTPTRSASAAPCPRIPGNTATAAAASATSNGNQSLKDDELEKIKKVLERAQRIDILEQERIAKLIDRLDNMKKHASGNGSSQCVLCADGFGMLGASSVSCVDCHKAVCGKCSIETVNNQQMVSLCKLCSENRELWKKSGAWFFRALPSRSTLPSPTVKPSSSAISSVTNKSDSISIDDDSSSDDRHSLGARFNRRLSPTNVLTTNHFTTVQSYSQTYENTNNMLEQDRDESLDSFKIDEQSSKELPIEEYIPKASRASLLQTNSSTSSSPVQSISPSQIQPLTYPIVHSSSIADDSGLGLLEFDIMWKEAASILTVFLIRSRGLRSRDSNGLSDPYVKLHLLPGVAKATKLRSHTIRRTLNPDFDETLTYHGISADDMQTKTLKFTVLDEDSVGADFLGEYRLKLSTIRAETKESYSVYLQAKSEDREFSTDDERIERGKLLISLLYSKISSSFHVRIIRGAQLLPMDFGQTSDPYCKLLLYPSTDTNSKSAFKTTVKKNTLQPEFNEEFTFQNIHLQDLIGKTLQILVFDKDVGKKDDYIGGFELGQAASADELKHWLLMVKSPEQWIDMWHKLKPDQYHAPLRQRDSQISR